MVALHRFSAAPFGCVPRGGDRVLVQAPGEAIRHADALVKPEGVFQPAAAPCTRRCESAAARCSRPGGTELLGTHASIDGEPRLGGDAEGMHKYSDSASRCNLMVRVNTSTLL